jgi:beta-galactosidase
VTTCALNEPGSPYQLKVTPDMSDRDFTADGSDIVMVFVHIKDKDGNLVTSSDLPVEMKIKGPACVVGDGLEIGTNPVKADKGIATFLIRSTTENGQIELTADCPGLKSGSANIESKQFKNEISY